MKTMVKIALVTGVLALACGNSALAAGQPEGVPPHGKNAQGKGPIYTPGESTLGPKDGLPAQAKAYGRRCKGESKEHVKGEKGTAFSRCVANLKQAANHKNMAPGQVCKGESKEHVKGEKGTEFSRCVKDVVEQRQEEREKEKEAAAV
jgi:hypothetical protein